MHQLYAIPVLSVWISLTIVRRKTRTLGVTIQPTLLELAIEGINKSIRIIDISYTFLWPPVSLNDSAVAGILALLTWGNNRSSMVETVQATRHTWSLPKWDLWMEEASDKRCIPGAVELVAFLFLPRIDMQRRRSVVAADKGAGSLMIFTGLYSGDFWRSMNDASLFSNTKFRMTRWGASWRYSGCLYFSSLTQW